MIGKLLERFRAPGLVRPFAYEDQERGLAVNARTSERYTVLTVGDTELCFERESGRFDGIGRLAPGDDTAANGLLAARIRESTAARAAAASPRSVTPRIGPSAGGVGDLDDPD